MEETAPAERRDSKRWQMQFQRVNVLMTKLYAAESGGLEAPYRSVELGLLACLAALQEHAALPRSLATEAGTADIIALEIESLALKVLEIHASLSRRAPNGELLN